MEAFTAELISFFPPVLDFVGLNRYSNSIAPSVIGRIFLTWHPLMGMTVARSEGHLSTTPMTSDGPSPHLRHSKPRGER